ncbi:MAG: repressor LexA [Deltaproteobacteria bacterium]|nr:repressor LexA [Deltaproteobacteria bacterium]
MGKTPKGETRRRVLELMRQRILGGAPPTVREVQGAMGFSAVQTARKHLETLIKEGALDKSPGLARGYRLRQAGFSHAPPRAIPLLGRVQAGALTTAVEEVEGYLPVGGRPPREDLFALRVRGESMTGAGILPGDVVIVRRQPTADPGEIVVALVGDEATVKRLKVRRGHVELHPENPAFSPMVLNPDKVTLVGKVIEVRRFLEGEGR